MVCDLRYAGRSPSVEPEITGILSDPEGNFCEAISVLTVAAKYDIVEHGESWFEAHFINERCKWVWRDHERQRLDNALYALEEHLRKVGLLEDE